MQWLLLTFKLCYQILLSNQLIISKPSAHEIIVKSRMLIILLFRMEILLNSHLEAFMSAYVWGIEVGGESSGRHLLERLDKK